MALVRPFRRLAIVNRGEPAMRLVHAVRELDEQGPQARRITVIALATEPERSAMFVRRADESFVLGPAITTDGEGRRRSGYLDLDALERALVAVRADAAWPGWGFVAERPEFAELCERLGIVFVGPDAATIRRLGDKVQAKLLAEEAGLPVAPWSRGRVADVEEAARHAERIGFPLMVKAAAGGGGRGIRRVDEAADLAEAFGRARSEAREAFGDDDVLLERLVEPARHVEVQVIADGTGTAWAVGVRDCSCQRLHQKVIEESASTALAPDQEALLREGAVRLALLTGYRGAATVEFLLEPESGRLSFMEVNTRLQVEHPVTEAVTGLDLVKLQLHVAAGGRLEGEPPPIVGHAVEARLNAEDPALGFAPTPGRVRVLELPGGPGVRVDRGVATGDVIPVEFDSMIAKVVAWGRDRPEAIARLRRAIADTVAVVEDGTTNRAFLLGLLDRPELRHGEVDTGWLGRLDAGAEPGDDESGEVALLQAAVELYDEELAAERAHFYALARRGRPEAGEEIGRTVELRHRGHGYRVHVEQLTSGTYEASLDGAALELEVEDLGPYERRLTVGARRHRVRSTRRGSDVLVEVGGVSHRFSRDDGGVVRSEAPAIVVDLPVQPGDEVAEGDVVAVLESMKMETSLTAPFAGRVRAVLAAPNVQVAAHAPLMQLEAHDGVAPATAGRRLSLPDLEATTGEQEPGVRCLADLERLAQLVLGYDVSKEQVRRIVADLHGACSDLGCSPLLVPTEHRLLDLYADLRILTRPQHEPDDLEQALLRSPQEYLHAFLRSLDAEAEGLPPRFVAQLERALAHYGVQSLERAPALEDACYRLFRSQQRADTTRTAVLAVLDRRLEQAGELVGAVPVEFREVLDRVEAATEARDQIVSDLAREVRYRYFDEPLVEAARAPVLAEMREHLDRLAADPTAPDREDRVRALVACPQVLAPTLSRRLAEAGEAERRVLLEVMTRRYYRVRSPGPFSEAQVGGVPWITAQFKIAGRRQRLFASFVDLNGLPTAARALRELGADAPDATVDADVYAAHGAVAVDREAIAAATRAALEQADLSSAMRRVVVAVADSARGSGMGAVDLVTLRRHGDGSWTEDEHLRGLHPEMAERLELWRLSEFELERLPAAEDVYLFHGVARSNPKDERLFALAEVRDLTPVRDDAGRVTALPELERMLAEALEGIRRFQSHRPLGERLLWNRVLLHAWPPIEVDPEDLRGVVSRYARTAGGLGIEMTLVRGRLREPSGRLVPRVVRFLSPTGHGVVVQVAEPPTRPLQPLDEGARRVVAARRRGTPHPAEVVRVLDAEFEEHDLDAGGRLVPVARPLGVNEAGIVIGLNRAFDERHSDGMLRVALLGDPTKALGSLAEPECRRIIAALDLAQELGVPLEWFALSAGAKIAMDSGTENMDWIADVLRRIVLFTQAGGEINVVVTGINVGAQPYWNAEATMLMHTRGILVMTPESAMVLTGKQALDYSGGVSAEDNFGIGGYERIMGPNGQAQYWAPDLAGACRVLLAYYEHAYVAPGERFPRRAESVDPPERDVRLAEHRAPDSDLACIGDVFSDATNPERKKPFDIRSVMRAAIDRDHPPLERWAGMHEAEIAVVWDAHLGGWPVAVLGIESRPLLRHGQIPADGPDQWTSGTLFPRAAKKIARAINAASGRRPVVVLANLAGFDGSPESMREWQLEYGAEIGRAVVNFDGPIVFCVVSRYHGGAFVVFSQKLNPNLETVALEGAHASVIGGAPAAAVVFARDVEQAARSDARIAALDERIAAAEGAERQRLRAQRATQWGDVLAEKRGEFAAQFDAAHSVERAVRMGSVSRIVAPASLRPYLIDAVERGMQRVLDGSPSNGHVRLADPLHR